MKRLVNDNPISPFKGISGLLKARRFLLIHFGAFPGGLAALTYPVQPAHLIAPFPARGLWTARVANSVLALAVQICLAEAVVSGNVKHARTHPEKTPMPLTNVLRFSENFDRMTFPECLAFIDRSRRQLHRLEHLPKQEGAVDPEEIISILQDLDALEHSIRSNPNCPEPAI
jgi:hypothetical protein